MAEGAEDEMERTVCHRLMFRLWVMIAQNTILYNVI